MLCVFHSNENRICRTHIPCIFTLPTVTVQLKRNLYPVATKARYHVCIKNLDARVYCVYIQKLIKKSRIINQCYMSAEFNASTYKFWGGDYDVTCQTYICGVALPANSIDDDWI